jgi:hypothetical protein
VGAIVRVSSAASNEPAESKAPSGAYFFETAGNKMRAELGNCYWEAIDFIQVTEITVFPMGTGYPFHANRARRESGQFTACADPSD